MVRWSPAVGKQAEVDKKRGGGPEWAHIVPDKDRTSLEQDLHQWAELEEEVC